MSKEELEITTRCPICNSENIIYDPQCTNECVCLDCGGAFTIGIDFGKNSDVTVYGCIDKEAEILYRFEATLHYSVTKNDEYELVLHHYEGWAIIINKKYKSYKVCYEGGETALYIGLDEHLLLHELFKCWGWI